MGTNTEHSKQGRYYGAPGLTTRSKDATTGVGLEWKPARSIGYEAEPPWHCCRPRSPLPASVRLAHQTPPKASES